VTVKLESDQKLNRHQEPVTEGTPSNRNWNNEQPLMHAQSMQAEAFPIADKLDSDQKFNWHPQPVTEATPSNRDWKMDQPQTTPRQLYAASWVEKDPSDCEIIWPSI